MVKTDTPSESIYFDIDWISGQDEDYYLALNNQPYIKLNDEYYRISEEEKETLYTIIKKYLPNWRK